MKTVKIGDICKVIAGQSPVGSSYNDNGNGIEFHQGKKLFGENEIKVSPMHTTQPTKIAEAGDILMSVRAPVGPVNYTDRKICIGRGLAAIRAGANIDKSYLFHFLRMNEANTNGKEGAIFASINKKDIEAIELPLPSIEEQQQIVARLDGSFETIARAEALMKQSLDDVAALQKSILRKYLSASDSTHTHRLREICSIASKLVDPRIAPYIEQLHVGAANIVSDTGELIDLRTSREEKLISGKFPFNNNMVLYSKIRPYLKKVVRPDFNGICSADIYPLLPGDALNRDYLYYLLLTSDFTEYAISGSQRAGMPKVNREHLFEYRVNLPSVDKQKEIVTKLDESLSKTRQIETKYIEKRTKLTTLRNSLLNQAFSTTNTV
jgi:type I restriction enzyme S subunit